MKTWIGALLILLLGLAGGAVLGPKIEPTLGPKLGSKPAPVASDSGNKSETIKPSSIQFAAADLLQVGTASLERSIPITGTLKAGNLTIVKSKAAGDLKSLAVRHGMDVKRGQVLGQVDTTEVELRVREREAQVRSAQATWDQAKRSFDNNKALVDKNFISQTALDNSKAQLDAAQSARDAAQANLALAKRAVQDTVIIAPIAGTVGERFAQAGEKVSPDTRILSLLDLSSLEVEAAVPASEVAALTLGQTVELAIEGVSTKQTAKLIRINPSTSSGSRSVPLYLSIANADVKLRAGLFAEGSLAISKKTNALAIPLAAVRDNAGRKFVYLVEAGKLVEREVTVGLRDENAKAANGTIGLIEIASGLKVGEQIVAANLGALRAGSAVEISK